MNLTQYISALKSDPSFMNNVACWRELPARPARYADFPESLDPRIREVISRCHARMHHALS